MAPRLLRAIDPYLLPEVGPDAPLPAEFPIFRAGETATSKGAYTYDATAEASILAAYAEGGVDLVIDLEHDSLDEDTRRHRADAGDARGWFKLEARGGDLYAVGVRWTPDGERRLREKTQRYISPAFYPDAEGRPAQLINVALCAAPATYHAPALVAASRRSTRSRTLAAVLLAAGAPSQRSNMLNPDQVRAALEAIKAGDLDAALALLEEILITSATAGGEPATPPAPPEIPVVDEGAAMEEPPEDPEEVAALRDLAAATGAVKLRDIAAEVVRLRASADAAELDARRAVIAELVALGAETPATAWDGDPAHRKPAARLLRESIADASARVAALRAARATTENPITPPPSGGDLTTEEARLASSMSPEQRARFVALRAARRNP